MVSFNDMNKNKTLQGKIKKALMDAVKAKSIGFSQLYSALFMLSVCETYDDQMGALQFLSYEIPGLNKVLAGEKVAAFVS